MILTRPEVIDVRQLVTVAEITTTIRGLSVEVEFDHKGAGINRPSVINCDGLHTIAQASLAKRLGSVDNTAMGKVCGAMNYALGY